MAPDKFIKSCVWLLAKGELLIYDLGESFQTYVKHYHLMAIKICP